VAPVAAFTMACILFVYARMSISAAKANAQRHRDVDSAGEGISLYNEHRRRHGGQERVDRGGSTVVQLVREGKKQVFGGKEDGDGPAVASGKSRREEEDRKKALREAMIARKEG